MFDCNEQVIHLHIDECDDCSDIVERVKKLEEMMDEIYTKQITFTKEGAYVCSAIVCEAILCGELTVDAEAEYIVESINKHNANNIVMEIDGVKMYVSDAKILDADTNAYRLIFPYPAGDGLLYHVVEGDNDGCELVK